MIDLSAKHQARLYLMACRALETSDDPQDAGEARRHGLTLLISQFSDGAYAMNEVVNLVDAMSAHLDDAEIIEPFSCRLSNVAALLGGTSEARTVARAALELLGARRVPIHSDRDDDWSTAQLGEDAVSVQFPPDTLVRQMQLICDEAKMFADKMEKSAEKKERIKLQA